MATRRLRRTLRCLFGPGHPYGERVVAVRGDVTKDGLGLGRQAWPLADRIDEVVHGAASVSFELPLGGFARDQRRRHPPDARVRRALPGAPGTACGASPISRRRTWRASTRAPSARTTSTSASVSATPTSAPSSRPRGSSNAGARGCRSRSCAPASWWASSDSGWTPSFNVIYWPLRAFSRGAYRVLPARGSAPVDVVPVDYVADATFALSQAPARRRRDPPPHRGAARQQRGRAGRARQDLLRPPRPAAGRPRRSTGGCCTR